jgi:D-alanyl-lipoteichoic acid acyltransferase DltB (MBOAT superfamily)
MLEEHERVLPVAILILLSCLYLVLQQAWPQVAGQAPTFLVFALCFLLLVMSLTAVAWLFAFVVLGYFIVLLSRRFPKCHPLFFVGPLVLLFAIFKRYEIFPLEQLYAHIPDLTGVSYIVFRVLMFVFAVREGNKDPRLLTYLNFCLSPFTFLSGPIQRLRDFLEDMDRRKNFRVTEAEAAWALTRMTNGLLKVLFIGPFIQEFQSSFLHAHEGSTVAAVLHGLSAPAGYGAAALCYLLFLYFNFSGYTDIVIGLGRLFGFHLPENFNRPFAATSFLDFWTRWHITLSLWFRDYCFTPILKYAIKSGVRNPVVATMPAYFISFGLLGLWHGRTWPFVLCGLMFATGSVLNHSWRVVAGRLISKDRLARLNSNQLWRALASAVTFVYIAIAITGLWLTGPEFIAVLRSFTLRAGALATIVVTVALAVAILAVRVGLERAPARKTLATLLRMVFETQTSLAIAIKIFAVIVWYFSFSTRLPDFVYRGF